MKRERPMLKNIFIAYANYLTKVGIFLKYEIFHFMKEPKKPQKQ